MREITKNCNMGNKNGGTCTKITCSNAAIAGVHAARSAADSFGLGTTLCSGSALAAAE